MFMKHWPKNSFYCAPTPEWTQGKHFRCLKLITCHYQKQKVYLFSESSSIAAAKISASLALCSIKTRSSSVCTINRNAAQSILVYQVNNMYIYWVKLQILKCSSADSLIKAKWAVYVVKWDEHLIMWVNMYHKFEDLHWSKDHNKVSYNIYDKKDQSFMNSQSKKL